MCRSTKVKVLYMEKKSTSFKFFKRNFLVLKVIFLDFLKVNILISRQNCCCSGIYECKDEPMNKLPCRFICSHTLKNEKKITEALSHV